MEGWTIRDVGEASGGGGDVTRAGAGRTTEGEGAVLAPQGMDRCDGWRACILQRTTMRTAATGCSLATV